MLSFLLLVFLCVVIMFTLTKIRALNEDENLFGKIIYIDAGHGGKDNGASVENVLEDNINLNISKLLAEKLIDAGAYVLMSRTSDYDLASLYDKNRKRTDLLKRVNYINNSKPDIFISIHLNTYSSPLISGPQVFYQDNEDSKQIAEIMQKKLNDLSNRNRNSKYGDFYILNNTKCPGILIECGFLSNLEERHKLNNSNYQEKLSDNIKKSLNEYFMNKR